MGSREFHYQIISGNQPVSSGWVWFDKSVNGIGHLLGADLIPCQENTFSGVLVSESGDYKADGDSGFQGILRVHWLHTDRYSYIHRHKEIIKT